MRLFFFDLPPKTEGHDGHEGSGREDHEGNEGIHFLTVGLCSRSLARKVSIRDRVLQGHVLEVGGEKSDFNERRQDANDEDDEDQGKDGVKVCQLCF